MFRGGLLGLFYESIVVVLVLLGNIVFQWIVLERSLEQTDQSLDDESGSQLWLPWLFNSCLADLSSILFNVHVVDLGQKGYLDRDKKLFLFVAYLGWLLWVVSGKVK